MTFSHILNNSETCDFFFQRKDWDTQRIVSVNYVFGRPLIPSDFLKRIVTLNFRRNLRIVINVLLCTEERSAFIFGKAISFREMDKKALTGVVVARAGK